MYSKNNCQNILTRQKYMLPLQSIRVRMAPKDTKKWRNKQIKHFKIMTKAEIVQKLTAMNGYIATILEYCTNGKFAKRFCEDLKQETVAESLSCFEDIAEDLQDVINALLTEHGDKDMVSFAEEDNEGED